MALLRRGGMGRVFARAYAPSTLGSFLRAFSFGHVRQLDAAASRFLTGLAGRTSVTAGVDELAIIDVDDIVIEVHGYAKPSLGRRVRLLRGARPERAAGHRQHRAGCCHPTQNIESVDPG